jgi:hypothetical protein
MKAEMNEMETKRINERKEFLETRKKIYKPSAKLTKRKRENT